MCPPRMPHDSICRLLFFFSPFLAPLGDLGALLARCFHASSLPAWMEPRMNRLQPVLIDVRVDLRRTDVAVAQQLLDDAQVRAAADEVGGEAVPERMGGD